MLGNLVPIELLVVLVLWLLPLAAFVWALVTLARLRRGQEVILTRITALEAVLARPGRASD